MLRKILTLIAAAGLCTAVALTGARAAVIGHSAASHKKTTKRGKPVKKNGLSAPTLIAPTNGAEVEQIPTLTWNAVGGAIEYEYEVASDSHFNSIVLGTGRGRGSSSTYNLAATLSRAVPDGNYYWRVRALGKTKAPGPWSGTRVLRKAWRAAPQLLGPPNGAAIAWPSVPLVLSWTPVPNAAEYIVTIAADPALSNIVLGTATSPQKTDATVFAFPSTLPVGQYYWAITPVDAEGHRGTRSAMASFSWSWPTGTPTHLADLNPAPEVFDPQFSWAPVPGAAKYEVEVNSAPPGFPVGSKVCCEDRVIGTSYSPTKNFGNNEYDWRVRAVDAKGNAGQWNTGVGFPATESLRFVQSFDGETPTHSRTIENLTMADAEGNPIQEEDPETNTPIVTWSSVPGAASYEVQITPVQGGGCNWGAEEPKFRQTFETATTAWTPLSIFNRTLSHSGWPHPRTDLFAIKEGGTPYCVRVAARSDVDARANQVVSAWTQMNGPGRAAFRFASQPAPGSPTTLETQAGDYLPPHTGTSLTPQESLCGLITPCQRTPFFTWKRVPGASLYYVVISRDQSFTNVVDVATTLVPAYAPPLGENEPLSDETTQYYWAVIPAKIIEVEGHPEVSVEHEPPYEDAPQAFNKYSTPPTPLAPVNGAAVANQPTFSWTPTETALNYTLQVSADPSFGEENLLDKVTTDSIAYTSASTYPANVTLYWRVRANDANFHNEGLNWSPTQTFTRTLPSPTPQPGNPTGGQAIPALYWTPVTGAIAYDVHVDQPNGGTKDFTVNSTAFTATEWYGTGIWRWEVRAEFPSGFYSQVPGGYFAPQAFLRTFAAPAGAAGTKAGSRIVISWDPDPYAKEYKAEVSTTESFSTTVDSERVDGASWAPANVDLTAPSNKGALYWRVAAIDQGDNTGPYVTGSFVPPKPKCVVRKVKKKHKTLKICVASKPKHPKKKHG